MPDVILGQGFKQTVMAYEHPRIRIGHAQHALCVQSVDCCSIPASMLILVFQLQTVPLLRLLQWMMWRE